MCVCMCACDAIYVMVYHTATWHHFIQSGVWVYVKMLSFAQKSKRVVLKVILCQLVSKGRYKTLTLEKSMK